ncbi:MAG: LLM class flavin-dependent oxidoreductase [Actinomycetia bacterium]|nr:LLM class flavin-dependent oxidoreductase [Actinomycetes bacterium]
MTALGMIFSPHRPPEQLLPVARAAEDAGLEQLWLWEDCFAESGLAPAAAVLASTERLTVGIGLLPVPLRNVALTAMELATVERLFPGRLLPGIGHGVLNWMGQVGARAASPLTLLGEYAQALRGLLHGQRVSAQGRYVKLTDVELAWPPDPAPPLLVGAMRPKTAQLAGQFADGLITTEQTPMPEIVTLIEGFHAARAANGPDRDATALVVAFTNVPARHGAREVADQIGAYVRAGATHVIARPLGDDVDAAEYAAFLAGEVRPLLD